MQQAAEGAQPLRQALRIVQAVHPHQQPPACVLLAHRGQRLLRVVGLAQALERVDVDADREGLRAHAAAERGVDVVGPVLGAGLVVHVAAEVHQVGLALEPQQVVGEERAHQPLVLRDRRQQQRRRQRDVQEEAHALPAAQRTQFGRQRDQVVVVDPHQVVGRQQRRQPLREQAVDAAVAVDVAAVEVGQVEPVVEHRPQHAVGVAQVVRVVVGLRQVHRGQRHVARPLLLQRAFAPVAAAHGAAAPAEPQAPGGRQGGAQCHGQAARSGLARIGDAVGNHHQPRHQTTESQGADRRTAPLIRPTIE